MLGEGSRGGVSHAGRTSPGAPARTRSPPRRRRRRASPSADCTISTAAPGGPHRLGPHALPHRPEQLLARPRSTPPPRTTSSGSKRLTIDVSPHASASVVSSQTRLRDRVARPRGARDVAAVGSAGARASSCRRPGPPRRALGDRRARRRRPRGSRGGRSRGTGRPCQSTVTWPSSPPLPLGAAVELAVEHDAAADAGRDRQVDHVARAGARAVAVLAGGGRGRVVLERGRPPERVPRRAPSRARRASRAGAAARSGSRASASSGPPQPIPTATISLPARAPTPRRRRRPSANSRSSPCAGPSLGARRLDDERVHAAGRVDDARRELRPADVEPEHGRVRRDAAVRRRRQSDPAADRHQPFRPWVAIPSTKYRWKTAKRMTIGRTVITVPAMMISQRPSPPPPAPCWSRIVFRPSGSREERGVAEVDERRDQVEPLRLDLEDERRRSARASRAAARCAGTSRSSCRRRSAPPRRARAGCRGRTGARRKM